MKRIKAFFQRKNIRKIINMLGLPAICLSSFLVLLIYPSIKTSFTWRSTTAPLSSTVVEDVCNNIPILDTTKYCTSKKEVYGPELFPYIEEYFLSFGNSELAFSVVSNKLGDYLLDCGDVIYEPNPGREYFDCVYDLQGDEKYPITIFFYSDGRIMKMFNSIGD